MWILSKKQAEALVKLFHEVTFNRWNKELIREVLDCPLNARGFYKGNPQYHYKGFWVVMNERCNRILKYKRMY